MKLILKYLVLSFCSTFLDAVKYRCDYRYTQYGAFKYHEIPATWNDARLHCQMEGAILASPTTPKIKSIMLESFCTSEIFTGISDTFTKGFYYSIDGIPLSRMPLDWAKFEPDNKNDAEHCLTLDSDGKFSDVGCNELRPYICYRNFYDSDLNVCGTSDSEYHYESSTYKCYKFHTKKEMFAKAKRECFSEGGHLVIINSEAEAKILTQIFQSSPASKDNSFAFVGFLWDNTTEWTTIFGQSIQNAGFAKFGPGEPSGGEFCGSLYRKTGLLNDIVCNYALPFFCEKSPNFPTICDSSTNDQPYHNSACDKSGQYLTEPDPVF